jgi:hypothetical protein
MGLVGGYYAGRLYKSMKGKEWKRAAFLTGKVNLLSSCAKFRSFLEDSCANLVSFKIAVLFVLICIESTTILKETRFAQLSS